LTESPTDVRSLQAGALPTSFNGDAFELRLKVQKATTEVQSLKAHLKTLFHVLKKLKQEVKIYPSEEADLLNFERAMGSQIESTISHLLDPALEDELKSQPPKNFTSHFFVCKNMFCDGAFSLQCEKFQMKADLKSHSCVLS
jgi:hypothetical protein